MTERKDLWPTKKSEATADALMRFYGSVAQRRWLRNMKAEHTNEWFKSKEYFDNAVALIAQFAVLSCLRSLKQADPAKADQWAVDHWRACRDCGSVGEWLWQYLAETGIDPATITLEPGGPDERPGD